MGDKADNIPAYPALVKTALAMLTGAGSVKFISGTRKVAELGFRF